MVGRVGLYQKQSWGGSLRTRDSPCKPDVGASLNGVRIRKVSLHGGQVLYQVGSDIGHDHHLKGSRGFGIG